LYYSSNADGQGWQLWKTDGTAAGTHLVKVLTPGSDANPTNFVNVNGLLYFTANDGARGFGLWSSSGTTAGTQLIYDFTNPSPNLPIYPPTDLTSLNGRVFFAADDGVHGPELWQSNGTAAGTTMVADIRAGSVGSAPGELTVLDGILLFGADDGVHGPVLWESDGTQAGTIMVPGIRREGASNPAALTVLWNKLFFIADDGIHGMEPWIISVTATPGSALPAYLAGASVSVRAGLADSPVAVLPGRPEGPGSSRPIDLPRNQLALAQVVPALSRLSAKPVDALFSVPWTESFSW
jgi:ELWxxDGT repeat protein